MPASHQKLKQQTLISYKDRNSQFAQWLWEVKACGTLAKWHTNENIWEPGEWSCFSGVLKCYQSKKTIWNTSCLRNTPSI